MTPLQVVKAAEDAYASQNLERVAALFHRDVEVWWNGNKTLTGRAAVVESEGKNFASWTDFTIHKTLHVANGDDLGVEWTCSYTSKATGKRETVNGAEFWKLKDGQLIEWRAFSTTV